MKSGYWEASRWRHLGNGGSLRLQETKIIHKDIKSLLLIPPFVSSLSSDVLGMG